MLNLTFAFDLNGTYGMLRGPDDNIYHTEDYHEFCLPNKGIDPSGTQSLKFIHGISDPSHPEQPMQYVQGISDEQLLEVIIKRTEYFQRVLPCKENEVSLSYIRAALNAKLERTARRQAQNVEGTGLSHA